MKRFEDIAAANEVRPDFVGFVFAPSKRQINSHQAGELKALLDPRIQVVGVFVNEDPDHIVKLVNDSIIDFIQLHGDENESYITALKSQVDAPIIKAFRVKGEKEVAQAMTYDVDGILFDAWHERLYGGSGTTFNWSMLEQATGKPFFLAGGLTIDNIEEAVKTVRPYAVDVSSGAETDGVKDPEKMKVLVEKVRSESNV